MSTLVRWTARNEAVVTCSHCGAVHRARLRVCPLCARASLADLPALQRENRRAREAIVLTACVVVTVAFIIGWFIILGQR